MKYVSQTVITVRVVHVGPFEWDDVSELHDAPGIYILADEEEVFPLTRTDFEDFCTQAGIDPYTFLAEGLQDWENSER